MEKEERLKVAKEYLERARGKLRSAEILLKNGMLDDAVSRAYYAAYLSAYAVLYLLGEAPKSHDGLMYAFGLKLVRSGLVDRKYGKILSRLRRMREESDYAAFIYLDEPEVKELLEEAKEFVSKMEEIVNEIEKGRP